MLQPKKYPEMLGKALVFEAEPFIDMVDDDEPWAEGLFLVVLVGVLVGIAQIVGALLTAASMPQPEALLNCVAACLAGVRGRCRSTRRAWLGRRSGCAVVAV